MTGRLLYRSTYCNSTVVLRAAGARTIAIVAGKHGPFFPYHHEKSQWDSLLLFLDGVGYACSAQTLIGLQVSLRGQTTARIAIHDILQGSDGKRRAFAVDLCFEASPCPVYTPGKLIDWRFIPGLRWQPFHLVLRPEKSRFRVAGKTLPLVHGAGEIEQGELVNLRWRSFAFRYDYLCVIPPGTSHVRVDLATRSLTRQNPVERAVDWLLRRTGRYSLDLGPDATAENRPRAARGIEVLVEDRVDLGPAVLDRQLISARDQRGGKLLGLREIFHPINQAGQPVMIAPASTDRIRRRPTVTHVTAQIHRRRPGAVRRESGHERTL